MYIENIKVFNFEGAIRGMRNPMNSWRISDSMKNLNSELMLGDNDLDLCRRLIIAGSEHRKFLRHIMVSFDMTTSLKIWKQIDCYKHIDKNSCSTMYKLKSELFSMDKFCNIKTDLGKHILQSFIDKLNDVVKDYNETKSTDYLSDLYSLLPCGYLQKRTCVTNYECLLNLFNQREHHKLDEYKVMIECFEKELPYVKKFREWSLNK